MFGLIPAVTNREFRIGGTSRRRLLCGHECIAVFRYIRICFVQKSGLVLQVEILFHRIFKCGGLHENNYLRINQHVVFKSKTTLDTPLRCPDP